MNTPSNRFAYAARIGLYVIAGLLPLLFLPQPLGIEFGREVAFSALILIAGMLWLVSVLTSGEVRWPHSPILYLAGGLVAVFGVSTILSHAPIISALFADAGAEKYVILAGALVLMGVAGSLIRSPAEAGLLVFILIFAGALSAGLNAFQLIVTGYQLPFTANVIGTVNGLSLFYAALFLMTAGLIVSSAFGEWKKWVRIALVAAAAVFLFDLLLINFRTAWIVLLGSSVFLFGLLLIEVQVISYQLSVTGNKFGWRHWVVLGLIALSILMMVARGAIFPGLNLPLEVSPSFWATMRIAGAVFREGPLEVFFGSGPGTFGFDWLRYKDPAINQTVFWGVRFNQGQSWAATILPTAGFLGFAAFLAFLAGALLTLLKPLLAGPAGPHGLRNAVARSTFIGFVALAIAAFLYPANLTLILLFFLNVGALLALLKIPVPVPAEASERLQGETADFPVWSSTPNTSTPEGARGFWDIRETGLRFQAPWVVFVSSLLIIFFLALGVMGIYGRAQSVRAAYARQAGLAALSGGKIDESLAHLERAMTIESGNPVNYSLLVQGYTEKVRGIIQRAAQGQNVQQEFQQAISLAIQQSRQAIQIHPQEPTLWRLQGGLYELVIPYVQGSERPAFAAYQKAAELDPQNPAIYTEWGRAGLVFADRILALASQAQAKERGELEQARKSSLEEVAKVFQKAIEIKPDFAAAHFLLAQTLIRLGNLEQAIQSVENAKQAAPFDIGVAFQLGLLYYQRDNLERAQSEFERAITINDNYSNARYFLGLIYDRRGERQKALAEFERIAALNPDNQEVKRILDNLRAGKPALAEIVPPAQPPEKRKETPVKEKEGRK